MDPELAVHLRRVMHCDKCKRKRGFELLPNRNAAGRVENHKWRCSVCGTPSQTTITLTTAEVEQLRAEGEAVKAQHDAEKLEKAREYALNRLREEGSLGPGPGTGTGTEG